MNPYLAILRPNVCLLTVLGVVVGALVAGTASLALPFYLALIAAFLICGAGDTINDYFDREIDKVNAPHRPIPSGKISAAAAIRYFGLLTVIGLALAYFVSLTFLAIAAFNWLVAAAYPWKAKKIPVVKNIFVAYLAASSFLAAGFITGITLVMPLLFLVATGFIVTLGREIVKDIEDIKGDLAAGVKTLPTLIGEKPAKAIAYLLVLLGAALLALPYYLGFFSLSYLIGAVPGILVSLYSMTKPAAKGQKLLKAAMYFVILGFLLGAVVRI
jgi:geranylgeranylglycerol-phosphate geranylgeranyltransferase